MNHKFLDVASLRSALYHEFEDDVPDVGDFNIGYFEGREQKKKWLVSTADLESMYSYYSKKTPISLWCDGKDDGASDEEQAPRKRRKRKKRDTSPQPTKEDARENKFQMLKKKHGNAYSGPQLRLWARMIVAGTHEDTDEPPACPMITGFPEGIKPKESLSDAFASAAKAVTHALSTPKSSTCFQGTPTSSSPPTSSSSPENRIPGDFSPQKKIELRMKNMEQLRQLRQLQEEGILNTDEYGAQKKIVLMALNNLV